MRTLILILSITIFSIQAVFGQGSVLVNKGEVLSIGEKVYLFKDSLGLSIDEISSVGFKGFELSQKEVLNFSNNKTPIWGKIIIKRHLKETIMVQLASHIIYSADFYLQKPDGSFKHSIVNITDNFLHRDLKVPTVFYEIPAEAGDHVTLYFKVTGNYMQFKVHVGTAKGFLEKLHHIDILYGVFFGAIIFMFLYNGFIYVSVKDIAYLYYVLYVLLSGLFIAHMKGYGHEYLWPFGGFMSVQGPIWTSLTGVFSLLFAMKFLKTKELSKRTHRLLITYASLYGVALFFHFIGIQLLAVIINQLVVLVCAVSMLFISSNLYWKKRYKPARIYGFAWGLYLFAIIYFVLSGANILPYTVLSEYSVQIGTLSEMILLSVALADKIKILKAEKEELITRQNVILEAKVIERTEELVQTNEELNITVTQLNMQNIVIEEKNRNITASISYAQRIQEAMLPDISIMKKAFKNQFFALYIPKNIVSGDFYWFHETEDYIMLAAVDCTGHGVPGAFMSLIGNDLLREIVLKDSVTAPNEVLDNMHVGVTKALKQHENDNNDGMDVALLKICKKTQTLYFSGAHNPLWVIDENGYQDFKGNKLCVGGRRIGIQIGQKFVLHTVKPQGETNIYLFSDGYADQIGGPKDRKFMIRRFRKLIQSIAPFQMPDQGTALKDSFDDWKGGSQQIDDIMVLGARINFDREY